MNKPPPLEIAAKIKFGREADNLDPFRIGGINKLEIQIGEYIKTRISVLQNPFPHYRINFCTTESVLQKQFLYYRNNLRTTESISVLQNQFLYYRINFCTAELIPILQNRISFRAGEGPLKSGQGHLK